MKSNKFLSKREDYKYQHIYDIFVNYFKFNESKYSDIMKDIIKVLVEFEKKGETVIDVDKVEIDFELFSDGWPDKHIKGLSDCGMSTLNNSPVVIRGREISWSKWRCKLDRITNLLLNKIRIQNDTYEQSKYIKNSNNVDLIKYLFSYSDLVLLQGGPGTGKTTLVIDFIYSFLKTESNLNIGLSAPTGKATARIKESLNYKLVESDINLATIECQTLHSWIYKSVFLGKSKLALKDLDLLVIDECSMLSIDILEEVLEIINNDCKILLVGDAKQLPPINNCSIWNNIFENMKKSNFKFCTVNLNKIYRNSGDIQKLSSLIFNNDESLFGKKANQIIKSTKISNVSIDIKNTKSLPNKLQETVISHINKLKNKTYKLSSKNYIFDKKIDNLINYEKDLVLDIFDTLNSQLILCARNTGTWGVEDINSIIIKDNDPYDFNSLEEGIPIMCTENNNEIGISNGDIGVLIGSNKTRRFLFRKFNKENELIFSLIEPYKLEKIVPAVALTIHKSQGSESEKVIILWNQDRKIKKQKDSFGDFNFFRDNYEKRLFYTGITRAKTNLDIYYLD